MPYFFFSIKLSFIFLAYLFYENPLNSYTKDYCFTKNYGKNVVTILHYTTNLQDEKWSN